MKVLFLYCLLLILKKDAKAFTSTTTTTTTTTTNTRTSKRLNTNTKSIQLSLSSSLKEPDAQESNFGRREYWNKFYTEEGDFRWYSDWNDIQPFFEELVPLTMTVDDGDGERVVNDMKTDIDVQERQQQDQQQQQQQHHQQKPRVLLPGIGNDASMVDMYDYGYTYLTAFDYAEEGVECAKKFFGDRLLQEGNGGDEDEGVDLQVADARDLPFEDASFDAVLEKGTLDAIFLSGGNNKDLAAQHLDMSVRELARVVRKGGIVMSITAACADDVRASFDRCGGMGTDSTSPWKVLRDGGFYATDDGYTSNNIDATIFAWERI